MWARVLPSVSSNQFGQVLDNLWALFGITTIIGTVYFLELNEKIDHTKIQLDRILFDVISKCIKFGGKKYATLDCNPFDTII